MGTKMCKQMSVLKKIRKAGKLNGFAVELAEAQVCDYMALKHDVDSVKESVNAMQMEQAVQGGKLDLIIQRLNSPVEQERKEGIVWHEIRTALGSWKGWVIIILFIMCIAMSGERLLQLLHWIPTGA